MTDTVATDTVELPPVLTVKQYARFMQLTPATVSNLCLAGEIPAHKVGGVWRIPRGSIPPAFIPPPPPDPLGFRRRAKAAANRLADRE